LPCRFGPTRYSVIPKAAVGRISIRYVPDQEPEELGAAFKLHLQQKFSALGSSNQLSVSVEAHGGWWEGDPEGAAFKLAEKVNQQGAQE
jgi:Cys-Gly metallodipeptidase DUG1